MIRFLTLLVTCLSAVTAQQFTWEGTVDGIAVVRVHGAKVRVEAREGGPVGRMRYQFAAALPESRQSLRLSVREGRGSVQVTEQPGLENDYTAAVTIEDRQDGAAFYSFALDWAADSAPPPHRTDRIDWRATVDGEIVVECRAAHCTDKVERGRPPSKGRVRVSHPLPAADTAVMLDEHAGEAEIRILESPSAANGYTVRVRVRSLRGPANCSFVLSWPRPRR
jgi:hypothetical protein